MIGDDEWGASAVRLSDRVDRAVALCDDHTDDGHDPRPILSHFSVEVAAAIRLLLRTKYVNAQEAELIVSRFEAGAREERKRILATLARTL